MKNLFTVLGAGVAGLCVATELTRRGAAVQLVDPAGPAGQHACSWWAGGMLAPDCEGETAEEPVVRLGREAEGWWQAAGVPVTRRGSLVLAPGRDRAELDRFARRTENHRWLDRDELGRAEPALAPRFSRALHFSAESHICPRDALDILTRSLASQGVPVQADAPRGQIIDCRGLAAGDRLTDLRGVRGEMAVLRAPEVQISRPVRLLHPRHPIYIVPRGDGVYMLGATQLESENRGPATLRSVVELLNTAYSLDPAFAEAAVLELGADARPAFPDNLPRIRRHEDRIFVNGLFRHGFLLAPAMARMVADLVLEGKIPEVMDEDHGEWHPA
ncbi:FAD-dependent oxidoreductase [Paracoccus seriniphilus]|uniref:Glycine oxidase n=1 Tax=Paracoccus seriniphilus TaxID=184748 RepID=A0A239PWR2_9RHOB|nr:FAD-dependent oxidoreductase [Paracoccus seriniphilus]WCR13382.1 FAD-dependent oxidoreductase [Paracoccus seriniphilus]SNT74372.1 glycine oxidase [Paracoccus seriniphilus]